MAGRAAYLIGHGGRDSKGTALFNHVWMTRLDDELYSGLDDLSAVEEDLDVPGLGRAQPGEDGEGLA